MKKHKMCGLVELALRPRGKCCIIFLWLVLFPAITLAQDEQWNRWETDNFIILSYDEKQGEYLYKNIEKMKNWVFVRWGLPNVEFSAECKVACVPTKEMMQEAYRLNHSCSEIQREGDKIKSTQLFLILDKRPAKVIPDGLTEVCLAELCQRNIKIGFWARRGMAILNGTLPQIKGEVKPLHGKDKRDLFTSSALFSMTEDEWKTLQPKTQLVFDQQAAVVCLLLRKEFGQSKFLTFLLTDNTEQDLKEVFGFSSQERFDAAFMRYLKNLASDIVEGITPDKYLQITPSQ
jgi:hypothetical protein